MQFHTTVLFCYTHGDTRHAHILRTCTHGTHYYMVQLILLLAWGRRGHVLQTRPYSANMCILLRLAHMGHTIVFHVSHIPWYILQTHAKMLQTCTYAVTVRTELLFWYCVCCWGFRWANWYFSASCSTLVMYIHKYVLSLCMSVYNCLMLYV